MTRRFEAPATGSAHQWLARLERLLQLVEPLRPYRRRFATIGLITTLSVVFETAALASIVPLATLISSSKDSYGMAGLGVDVELGVWHLTAVAVTAILLKLTLGLIAARKESALLARYEADQRRRGFRAFLDASWARQSIDPPGHLQHLLFSVIVRCLTALRGVTTSMHAAAGLSIMLIGAFVAGGIGTLFIVVAIIGLVVALAPVLATSRRHARHLLELGERFSTDLEEATWLARDIRTYRGEQPFVERLDATIAPFEDHRATNLFLTNASALLFEVAGLLLVVGALVGLYLTQPDELSDYTVVALLMSRGLVYGRQLNNQIQACGDAAPFVMSLERTIRDYERAASQRGVALVQRIERIQFHGVGFTYDGDVPALRDVDLIVEHGDSVGVIGPSGSGKSTFLQILLQLREPTAGLVSVNGEPASSLSLDSWFERVNFVPQEPHLVRGTILDNIRFFRPDISDEECMDAARRTFLHEEILAMPTRYDTSVGARADALSGGQRQRLCVARALVGDPDLIVFDEPTSALDAHSEHAIHQTLAKLRSQTTLIIVAHRLSTIALCDRLVVFRNGRLEAVGSRDEIEANSTYYADVLKLAQIVS